MPRPKKITEPEAPKTTSKYRRQGADALGNPLKPKPKGRPSLYTEALADEIVERMTRGESMVKIADDDHMPDRPTIYRWMDRNPAFATRCTRAREGLADYLVDEIERLARTANKDNLEIIKLQISVAQWRAMKMAPKQYGDRRVTEVTGKDGGPIETNNKIIIDATQLPPDHRDALRAALLAAKVKG